MDTRVIICIDILLFILMIADLIYCFNGVLFFFFQIGCKNSSLIVLLLIFFVSALHHVYSSVSALHHVYCSVLSLHHRYSSGLSSSPQIFFCFKVFTTDILLFHPPPYLLLVYPLLGYPPLHHSLLLSSLYYVAV